LIERSTANSTIGNGKAVTHSLLCVRR